MINKAALFSSFPVIETDRLILSLPNFFDDQDVSQVYSLLNQKLIKRDYLNPNDKIQNHHTAKIYIYCMHDYFKNKKAIRWAIIEKRTNKIIGLRDVYFDSGVFCEIQGCISKEYRRKGYSQECYQAIFETLRSYGVTKYQARTLGNSIAPIKLLFSVGFSTTDIAMINNPFLGHHGWKLEFRRDLNIERDFIPDLYSISKDLDFFVHSFLRPMHIKIENRTDTIGFHVLELDAFYPMFNVRRKFNFGFNHNRVYFLDGTERSFDLDIYGSNFMKIYEIFIDHLSVKY